MASSQIDQKSTRPEARPDEEVGKSQSEATQRPGEAVKGRPNFGPEAAEARRGQERPGKGRAGREAEAVARNLNYFHPMLG